MASNEKSSIESIIIGNLQHGAMTASELIHRLSALRPGTTKQGVYRVLRKLKNEEKIVSYGRSVALNVHWLTSMAHFFSIAQWHYSPHMRGVESFLSVEESDRIVYFFKNLKLLDSFWSHAFLMLAEVIGKNEPIFVYNPHEWFSYARQETERALIKTLKEKSMQVFMTVRHDDPLDRALKKVFNDDFIQYDIGNKQLAVKENYYFNVFGDYLIEVFVDPDISKQIDVFFKTHDKLDKSAEEELLRIIAMRGKNRLIISKNKTKTERYKRMLAKNFYVKK